MGAMMTRRTDPRRLALAGVVLAHLAIVVAHGHAHRQAGVGLSLRATLFVYLVIVAGPPAGLALATVAPRPGALVTACSLAGALSFGVVNHFLAGGPDHVAQVAAGWRPLFGVTAVLLAISEAAGVGLALGLARERRPS